MTPNAPHNDRPKLDQKLVDAILDNLHDDPDSLKRCALVSKSFLPTSQRHLFSTFNITSWDAPKFRCFFEPSIPDTPRVPDLLNSHTTDLTFFGDCDWYFDSENTNFPKFPQVERIVFKGTKLIPRTRPNPAWDLFFSSVRSVELDFDVMDDNRTILTMLCGLPERVQNVGFTAARTEVPFCTDASRAYPLNKFIKEAWASSSTAFDFNGALTLNLAHGKSHRELLTVMLGLSGVFTFNLKRIDYHLTRCADIGGFASLIWECRDTLEFLDIKYSCPDDSQAHSRTGWLDFTHHRALRGIRIRTFAKLNPDWLREAIASVPNPPGVSTTVPPSLIELHISLPPEMAVDCPENWVEEANMTRWKLVDKELSYFVTSSAGTPRMISVLDGIALRIALDFGEQVTCPDTEERAAIRMFPRLTSHRGWRKLFVL